MDRKQAEQIGQKLIERIESRKRDKHVSRLRSCVNFARKGENGPAKQEYLFNILRELGYLKMAGFDFSDIDLDARIKGLFKLNVVDDASIGPTFIDFDDLRIENKRYEALWQEINTRIPDIQRLTIHPKDEEIWEDMWLELKDYGLTLLFSGFDLVAVRQGQETLTDTNAELSHEWKERWKKFVDNSDYFLAQLYDEEKLFYPFGDYVFSHVADYPCIPEGEFRNFILAVSADKESYPNDKNYRWIFHPDETKEIFYATQNRLEEKGEKSSAALAIFYHSALAEEVLKKFILRVCYAKQRQCNGSDFSTADWKLEGTQDIEYSKIPVLLAGQKQFSIHMLGPRVSGWGVRKDKIQPYLSNDETGFEGALFCSWKEYPTEEVLVRFDNYMERERFAKLLQEKRGEEFEEFVRLSPDEVYAEDKRKQFFQMAANAVMGLDAALMMQRMLEIVELCHSQQVNNAVLLDRSIRLMCAECLYAKIKKERERLVVPTAPRGPEEEQFEVPNINTVVVETEDEWQGLFFTHTETDENLNTILRFLRSNSQFTLWNGLYFPADAPYKPQRIENKSQLLYLSFAENIQEKYSSLNTSLRIIVFFSSDSTRLEEVLSSLEQAYKSDSKLNSEITGPGQGVKPVICINYLLSFNATKK